MKILIVNASDINGGAARAAYRLHQSLLMKNVNSKMLVMDKASDDFSVLGPISKGEKVASKLRPIFDSIPIKFYKCKIQAPFSISWGESRKIIKTINELKPDVVHLHWINGGMIKIEDLPKINAPIVWSLHDNWAFTGGCHIMWNCESYKVNCGNCPILKSDKEKDLSRKVWNRKSSTFPKLPNMTIVGLSNWLNECSKSSSLLKGLPHINLPNPINTTTFKPFDKKKARELWSLPTNKKLVLFGASNATGDMNKGFKELSKALHKLMNENIELVVFGSSEPKKPQYFGSKTHYLGRLHDDVSLVALYSAADVMVVPSLQENLSNAIMESLSCSTPVVAFDIGGNSDLIKHKNNGYLAQPFDCSDLAKGIEWVLDNNRYSELCFNARDKVTREFDSKLVAEKYIQLYKEILNIG
ncbi:glycosyltransferase family 4 protein [Aliivibrio sp. S3MY1]|uniref:glycosyltransferase family 4 protein n=1 Tax=unclassified Aliivibrio TaxID=2645654 RepID=UPI00237940D7|nr:MULTISPECIES: glycosyltransferase family 4 protein [unclassified Aliivibrio]MDD9196709.1 glycosyltransferase family 4 protein [Aliivibrio sp. S3MY1]MDD9199800.1 glycosyltransferase family 4 protein [Aliivibrio sp. S2MY1]